MDRFATYTGWASVAATAKELVPVPLGICRRAVIPFFRQQVGGLGVGCVRSRHQLRGHRSAVGPNGVTVLQG
jgi:hypothetical protein